MTDDIDFLIGVACFGYIEIYCFQRISRFIFIVHAEQGLFLFVERGKW